MRELKCRTLGHSLENYSFKFLLISDFDVADESSVCIVGRGGEKKGIVNIGSCYLSSAQNLDD